MSSSSSSSSAYSSRSSSSNASDDETTTNKPQTPKKEHFNVNHFRAEMADADSADSDEDDYSDEYSDLNDFVSDNSDGNEGSINEYRKIDNSQRKKDRRKEKKLVQKFQTFARTNFIQDDIELVQDEEALKQPFESYRIALEPSENTTPLFYIKTKPGKEFAVLYKITNRILTRSHNFVYSAFTRGISTGYIYVEAKTYADAQDVVNGIPEVTIGSLKSEPYKEMTKAIRIPRQIIDFKPGEFVEYIKNDKKGRFYKGDIGQVITTKVNNNAILVKSIPRLDYELLEKENTTMSEIVKRRQKESYMPPQNYFDEERLKEHGNVEDKPDKVNGYSISFKTYDGNKYYGGFLYNETSAKNIRKLVSLVAGDIGKKFDESTQDFEKRIPGFKEHMYQALGKTTSTSFRPGDVARILEGHEYENLLVDVKAVSGSIITVVPHVPNGIVSEFEIESELLEKHFSQGDKVEITAGVNRGKVGIVQSVNEKTFKAAVLISSLNRLENIELANLAHTRREEEIQVVLGRFRLDDYVILSDGTDGVIWRIEHDNAHIYLSTGKTRTANLSQIKTAAREAIARSQNGQQIIKGSIVKYMKKNINATVLHTGRGKVFLKSDSFQSNGGIFVADASEISVPNAAQKDTIKKDFTGGFVQARPRQDLSIKGKTIRIIGGKLKGQIGDVKEATEKDMRVFLHQTQKIVRIERGENNKNFKIIGDNSLDNKMFSSQAQTPVEENIYPKPQYADQPTTQPEISATQSYPYSGQAAYSPTSGGDVSPYATQYGSPGYPYNTYGANPSYGAGYASPSYGYGGTSSYGQGQYSPSNN